MNWTFWIVAVFVLIVFFAVKRISLVRVDTACDLLRRGAEVIDVRNPSEFHSGHIPGSINIPLGELKGSIQRFVPDKTTPLLLHCVSGGRSAIGTRLLRSQATRKFTIWDLTGGPRGSLVPTGQLERIKGLGRSLICIKAVALVMHHT